MLLIVLVKSLSVCMLICWVINLFVKTSLVVNCGD